MPVEKPVTFPYAKNPGGVLTVSARQFRNAWKRFAALHRTDLDRDGNECLPLLASNVSLSDALEKRFGHGIDVQCREFAGACHWDMRQAGTEFFKANAHIVEICQRIMPDAKKPTKHVRLLPPPQG